MPTQIDILNIDNEKVAKMTNSHFARSFSIGTNWTKIRMATRFVFINPPTPNASPVTGNPQFFFGMSHGTSSVIGDSSVSHSVGMITSGSSWTWTSGRYTGFALNSCVATASTVTTFGVSQLGVVWYASSSIGAGTPQRSLLFVDFERNSPNTFLTMSMFYKNNAANGDATVTDLLYYGQSSVPSGFASHIYTQSAFLPINETTNGILDSICAMWDKTAPNICISDLAIFKLS